MRACWVLLAPILVAGCVGETRACATSDPLSDGASVEVLVEVRTKPGLDTNIVDTLDVAGSFYSTPDGELGAETELAVGDHTGVVTRTGDELILDVEGWIVPLTSDGACFD